MRHRGQWRPTAQCRADPESDEQRPAADAIRQRAEGRLQADEDDECGEVDPPGRQAIPRDPVPIKVTENVNAARRPNRSAYLPNIQPPNGRTRNPTARMPAVFNSCAV